MPIFEYQCMNCGRRFEILTSSNSRVICEHCGSGKVTKLISTFAAPTVSVNAPACAESCGNFLSGRGGCCGGHCHGH